MEKFNEKTATDGKKLKMILRLFPYLRQIEKASELLIDDESIHYISMREYAEKISDIIKLHIEKLGILKDNCIITDATAGVGGDTISFSKNFHKVYAIEIDELRAKYLANNVSVYECNNITIINNDCSKILKEINDHDVIFIDPPWEPNNSGSYKQYDQLKLPFCDETIESFCNKLMDTTYMVKVPEIITLKLPKNYDIAHFYQNVNSKQIYYYNLNKMIILVIIVEKKNN